MIPQRDLSLLSNRLAKQGGRRIPETVLERDYCLSWFLVGLSRSPLRDRLAFKGGTALKKCYFGDYRFSEDLDFTLTIDVDEGWKGVQRQGSALQETLAGPTRGQYGRAPGVRYGISRGPAYPAAGRLL